MSKQLAVIFLVLVVVYISNCDDVSSEDVTVTERMEDSNREVRGFPDYETWKPSAQSSTPDVILIKQKEPEHHHHGGSLSSVLKDNLPLLAVLAPLAAVAVLFPLKAYFGANYVLYPPVTPAPSASRDRLGKEDDSAAETRNMAGQILKMIDELDKVYGENANQNRRK